MLTGIGLRNFKAFGDEMQEAPLSKITLIYGPNSGGKSSIIQALLLLKQSHEARTATNQNSLELVPRRDIGELVDLGSYRSLINGQESAKDLEIRISTENPVSGNSIRFLKSDHSGDIIRSYVHLTFRGFETSESHGLKKVVFFLNQIDGQTQSTCTLNLYQPGDSIRGRWTVNNSIGQYVDFIYRMNYERASIVKCSSVLDYIKRHRRYLESVPSQSISVDSFPNGLPGSLQFPNERIIASARTEKRTLNIEVASSRYNAHIQQLSYIGPIRQTPVREYPLAGRPSGNDIDPKVGQSGQNTPYLLHNGEEYRKNINKWFKEFGIPYAISVREHRGAQGTKSISLGLIHRDTPRVEVGLKDVGFGINQLLPIILQGSVSCNTIVCVEQPELHLHPRLQAHVADLLIENSKTKHGNQWIVETHSELLVRRIQTRIAQGDISPSDVSVLYVDPDDNACEGSVIKQLQLDENGYWLDEWPHGFFDDGYKQTRYARRARRNSNASKVRN